MVGAMFPVDLVDLRGTVAEYHYQAASGNAVTRVFCPRCGSPILGRNSGMPGHVKISLGVMDDAAGLMPQVVIFSRNRKSWDSPLPNVPTFDAQPDWTPERGL